jgi:hypothetical protein
MALKPASADLITRRAAIQRVSALLGGATLVGGNALLTACVSPVARGRADGFTTRDVAFLDEIADTILPETSTPGAKAARVGAFMALMVTDAYRAAEQRIFRNGMQVLEERCTHETGASFMSASADRRLSLLQDVDREQFDYMRARRSGEPVHYFRMMKELALLGYFTSEIGCTQGMRYRETPGRFDTCVPD